MTLQQLKEVPAAKSTQQQGIGSVPTSSDPFIVDQRLPSHDVPTLRPQVSPTSWNVTSQPETMTTATQPQLSTPTRQPRHSTPHDQAAHQRYQFPLIQRGADTLIPMTAAETVPPQPLGSTISIQPPMPSQQQTFTNNPLSTPHHVDTVIEESSENSSQEQKEAGTGTKPKRAPTMLKSFKFDGTDKCEDWTSFLVKFNIFADASDWSPMERRNQLCWCLAGSASRYGTNQLKRNPDITFAELVAKMEQRFNHANDTDTLEAEFNNARQSPGEGNSEWADRLSALADKAFRDMSEKYIQRRVIRQFLQALNDKETGKAVSMQKPETIDDACQAVDFSQHLDCSIYGTRKPTRPPVQNRYEEPTCQAMRISDRTRFREGPGNQAAAPTSDDQMATLMKNLSILQDTTQAAFSKIQRQIRNLEEGNRNPQNPRRDDTFICYRCNGYGHIARNCRNEQKPSEEGRQNPTPRQGQPQKDEKPHLND